MLDADYGKNVWSNFMTQIKHLMPQTKTAAAEFARAEFAPGEDRQEPMEAIDVPEEIRKLQQ